MNNYICYIGRPCYQKNTLFLIDVINNVHKQHPNIKFVLLGVGYYSPELEEVNAKIAQFHLESIIDLKPWMDHSETLKYVKHSLFYLTVARYEGLPLSVIEAMSLGKAIVASNVVGNKDCVIDGYNGYLLELDKTKFSHAVCELIEDKEKREYMGRNSRKLFMEKFFIETRISELEDIYFGKKIQERGR